MRVASQNTNIRKNFLNFFARLFLDWPFSELLTSSTERLKEEVQESRFRFVTSLASCYKTKQKRKKLQEDPKQQNRISQQHLRL